MAKISATPEQLKQQAKVYTQAQGNIQQEIAKVKRMNGTIAQEWEGAAFKAYLQQYDALEKQVKSFTDLLGNINKQLDKYADTIQQRDAEDAKGFGFK